MAQSTNPTRLCPHCANSIAPDIQTCPYCKANVTASAAPQWPSQAVEPAAPAPIKPQPAGMGLGSRLVVVLALLAFAVGGYLMGGQNRGSDGNELLAAKEKALQEGQAKIKSLEEQLARGGDELKSSAAQLDELKGKLEEQEKQLAAAQNKLKEAARDADRLASRSGVPPLAPVRSRDAARSQPLPPAPAPRRAVEPGLYETLRSTAVHEEPLGSSRVLTRIPSGTQVNVVGGTGEWLEVRSKVGNPPGFVRSDDVMLVTRAN